MSASPASQARSDLRREQRRLDAARMGRDAAIRACSDAGLSLRAIAEATGLGVETVRRIVKGQS